MHYVVKTTIADFYPVTYISIISEPDEKLDFSFLNGLLTEREINILTLIAQGYNNSDIASELYISINTVKYHLKNLFQKLEVSTRTELLTKAYALNSNITQPIL
jgi:DNA-binding NarL/FixJ family response regulator